MSGCAADVHSGAAMAGLANSVASASLGPRSDSSQARGSGRIPSGPADPDQVVEPVIGSGRKGHDGDPAAKPPLSLV